MKITTKLMEKVLRYDADSAAKYLNKLKKIEEDLRSIDYQIGQAITAHQLEIKSLKDKKLKIQKECDHPSVTHYSDPAGGYDKRSECDICGYDLGAN